MWEEGGRREKEGGKVGESMVEGGERGDGRVEEGGLMKKGRKEGEEEGEEAKMQ